MILGSRRSHGTYLLWLSHTSDAHEIAVGGKTRRLPSPRFLLASTPEKKDSEINVADSRVRPTTAAGQMF